jgi:hypothetical protein
VERFPKLEVAGSSPVSATIILGGLSIYLALRRRSSEMTSANAACHTRDAACSSGYAGYDDTTMTAAEIVIATAAGVQAMAAIAIWKATLNLVTATRDLVYANVAPELTIRLKNKQPFENPEGAVLRLENQSRMAVTELAVEVNVYSNQTTGLLEQVVQYQPIFIRLRSNLFNLASTMIWGFGSSRRQPSRAGPSFPRAMSRPRRRTSRPS